MLRRDCPCLRLHERAGTVHSSRGSNTSPGSQHVVMRRKRMRAELPSVSGSFRRTQSLIASDPKRLGVSFGYAQDKSSATIDVVSPAVAG